jgi:Ca2+-binding RTX toxin-like protein
MTTTPVKHAPARDPAERSRLAKLVSQIWGSSPRRAAAPRGPRLRFEALEPRLLLSADFVPEAADAIAVGFNQLESRVDSFIFDDAKLNDRIPMLLKAGLDADGDPVFEAPTVLDMLSVPVDANGNGVINAGGGLDFNPGDDDESVLDGLDVNHDDVVDASEFLQAWFFNPIETYLHDVGAGDTTQDFADFLEGNFLFNLDHTLNQLSNLYLVEFEIVDAQVADLTEDPDAEVVFSVGFQLTVSQSMPIDLGLEADGLKLLAFTGSSLAPLPVEVPVTSTLSFAFEFGVFTGGQAPASVNAFDFLVRRADPLLVSVVAQDGDLDFSLNVGFLGAQVIDGNFDLQADIGTTLVDPNDPEVLGFVDSQHGVESTSGVVTASNAVPSADLDHAAGFFLRIGNVGITTPVTVADGDAPGLATLKTHIQAALASAGLDELITADITGADKVQFALVPTSDTPLGFVNETLGLNGIINATPDGDGPNDFEYLADQVFLLSVGGALARVVTVRFPDPAKEELGFDYAQDASLPGSKDQVIAVNPPTVFDVTGDADFKVTVTLNSGAQFTQLFTVSAGDTVGNASAADLAADIDAKLNLFLTGFVEAQAVGGTIRFEGIHASVSGIRVEAFDTAVSEIGFAPDAQATLELTAADNAISSSDLSGTATFDVTVTTVGAGTTTTTVTVAPDSNASLAELAAHVDAALAAEDLALDAIAVGGRIVLVAKNVDVAAFSVAVGNQDLDDLVDDVNTALADAGLGSQVTASNAGGQLRLSADDGVSSLEISRTLTFDAGVTFAELLFTPTEDLFEPDVDEAASHATFELPVHVRPGLENPDTDDDWDPQDVVLLGNFSPLDSPAADFNAEAKRFELHFTLDPSIEDQDLAPVAVPALGSLSEEIRLVNMAELLNFSLVNAEGMTSLLAGLGSALQQLATTFDFAAYGIPFADATLADLLNFRDADRVALTGLIDRVLFDAGDDGVQNELGGNDADRLLRKIIEEERAHLIPNFVTAQEMASLLSTVLGVPLEGAGGINATYDTDTNELTYELDLIADDLTATTITTPFEYDVDLSPFRKTVVDSAAADENTEVTLEGRTGLEMTFGIDLSPPGTLIFPDTPLDKLSGGEETDTEKRGVRIKTEQAITGTVDIPVTLQDPNNPPPTFEPVQQLTGDAVFSVSIDGGTPVSVTVEAESTYFVHPVTLVVTGNRTMADLAVDVDAALAAADLGGQLYADYDGTRLVISARQPGVEFEIVSADSFAEDELGLEAGAISSNADFRIFDSSGGVHDIMLDPTGLDRADVAYDPADGLPNDPNVQDVINAINAQTGGAVVASLNAAHTGLRLVDTTDDTDPFRINSVNGSSAMLGLGFFRAGDEGTTGIEAPGGDPYLIEGGAISQVHLDKRFFVRDAEMRIDGLTLETPMGGVPGQALFGIVGVDTTFEGSMVANVTAALQSLDPVTSQVTLAELFEKTREVMGVEHKVIDDVVVSKAQELSYGISLGSFDVGELLTGDDSGATAIVVAVDGVGQTLTLSHVKGSFTDGEIIFQSGAAALADGVVSTNANFGDFDLGVDVQDFFQMDPDEYGFGTGFGLLHGMSYNVPVELTVFGDPGDPALDIDPVAPVVVLAEGDLDAALGDLAAFEHLSYSHIAEALHELEALLVDVNASFALFNTKIPSINRSIADLLKLVEGFERAVDNADFVLDAAEETLEPEGLELPALTLQDMAQALRGAFGLPDEVNPDDSGAVDWVRLDFDPLENMLLLDLSLNESLSTKLGLDIVVDEDPFNPPDLPNLTSGGILMVAGSLDINLHAGIDLAAPQNAYLFDDSSISAELHVEGEGQSYDNGEDGAGMVFYSSVGPLAVFIRDADAIVDVEFSLPGLDFGMDDRKLIDQVAFEDFDEPVIGANNVAIVLPMFYGGEGPDDFLGEFSAMGDLDGLTVMTPDFSPLADDITNEVIPFDPFDNIELAIDTIDIYFESLTDRISSDFLSLNLPFAGDQLADFLFIDQFRDALVGTLKNGIANAINPDPDSIVEGLLDGLFGPGGELAGYLPGGNSVVATHHVGNGIAVQDRFRQWEFTIARTDTIVLDDFDLGIPNLDFDVDVPVLVSFDWEIDFAFGVNFGDGAYIDVSDIDSDGTDIDLDLTLTLPGGEHIGELGYLRVKVTDPDNDTGAQLHFDIDVQKGDEPSAQRLAFADLGSLDAEGTLSGGALTGASHAVSLALETVPQVGLPTMTADFILDWSLAADTPVASLGGDAVNGDISKIALTSMTLDPFSVLDAILGDLLDEVNKFIAPFMPVVDTLTAPIPILSDVAGEPFTLLDLAGIFGEVDPAFLETIADILDIIVAIEGFTGANALPLGDLVLYEPGAGIADFVPGASKGLEDVMVSLDLEGLTHDEMAYNTAIASNSLLEDLANEEFVDGLAMPIFTDPTQGIKMLLGQTADIITYELQPLLVDFSYFQVFPIVGPLSVGIEIGFGFTLDLHEVGFDTFGYKRYADGGFRNPEVIFDGFFFGDLDENGVDAPEITMLFSLVGSAELNLGIARAGVGGGIDATITFDWHDSIPDGNVHISEILGNIAAEGLFGMFDLGGELTFELFAFIEFLTFRQEIPITGKQTLYSFEDTSTRDPILATVIGDTLQLNMGPNSEDRLNGDTSDGHEEFVVEYNGGDILVSSTKLGVSSAQSYSTTVEGGFKNIVGLGGQGNDVIELKNFDGTGIRGDFDGGVGDDRIEYDSSGASMSKPGARIVGGEGNDTLTGGDLNDVIYGGEGNDTINGGAGHDILFGDSGRVAETVTPRFISSRVLDSDGDDSVSGGDGDDVIFGAGGDDSLDGGAGDDVIIGDGGRFEYTTADVHGRVDIAALRPAPYVPTPVTTPVDPDIISGEIDRIYDDMVRTFTATDFGFGGDDEIHGGDDDDMILGGTGDDTVHGEGGDDIILGGKGFDDLHGGDDSDTMFGGDQADTMAGDAGDDVMSGGRGNDFMHGNEDDDVMKGDSGADVMFGDAGDDQVFGQTEPDILFGGADDDLVVGGTSNDIMFGDDGIVAKLDPTDGSALREIGIGFGGVVPAGQFFDDDERTIDLILTDVVADDGNDILSGDAGDDFMLGGGGNDLMGGDVDPRLATFTRPSEISEDVLIGDGGKIVFDQRRFRSIETVIGADTTGEPFHDVIYGDNGNDTIFGGRGNDFLFGGHGKVVDMNAWTLGASRGPTDAEADDNDIIVGDNGEMLFAAFNAMMPDNFGRLELVRTTDVLENTGGHDYVEGELDDDVIFGGVNGGVEHDVLLGHEGNDVVLGDNGELDFALGSDANLDTLDLIRSYRDGLGGTDEVSGHAGDDVLIGGTAGDLMYGDDATASAGDQDGEDIMLGDNADIFLIGNVGRLKVRVADMPLGTAVDLITTTDDVDLLDPDYDTQAEAEAVGGPDTMSGNAKADIMLGGVNDGGVDTMYGDRAAPTMTTIADDADDIMLGDNGLLDFSYLSDADLNTLDLIHSFEDGLGGTDVMSGNKGQDVAIGGTGDDEIYGDDLAASAEDADLGDLLLGDNADVFLVAPLGLGTGTDLKLVLDAAVYLVRTTDEQHPEYGGVDTISGNADADIIAGGVQGDTLYGDALSVVPQLDGDDVILGDNGAFEWLSTGRLGEILGIDIEENNPALFAKFDPGLPDTDLTTLDLITTEQPNNGGRDMIYGDEGSDLAFGGTDLDWIHGDDGDEAAETLSANRDVLFGDHGRLYPQFSALLNFHSRNFFAIDTGDADGGEGDLMWGEEGDDVMLGQQGDDRMWGGTHDDDMMGGHNVSGGYDELSLPAVQATLNPPMNDLMDGGSGDDAMAGDNTIMWRRGDDLSPRFRTLNGMALYTTGPDQVDTIVTNVNAGAQSDPDDAVGRDIELVDHADGTPAGLFGADVMAGGADSDVMYGQLGNDLMQGDGDISLAADAFLEFVTHSLSVVDLPTNETTQNLYFNIPELASDADDYMEGNGGDDLMYGGLGQDDILGGSSALFGLTTEDERPDGSDIIFGGAGAPVRLARNDFVGATDTDAGTGVGVGAVPTGDDPSIALVDRHSRDADYIMGDNANVYRLVGPGDAFLEYNFDQSSVHENRGTERIVVRAMEQLDYTLGGADYAGGAYTAWGAANDDNGAGDLIHGESGDDQIFGMTGSDVMFGESDDDDLVGGYGNDWISGGTGQDGVLGDDGLVYTSRNSTAGEPLYGVEGLLSSDPSSKYNNGTALNETISTPGDIQFAVINVEGELKKSADLVPFSFDPGWLGLDDEFPDNETNTPFADDIIFGGLGGDFLHGGSGDDAISGAEALEHAYVPVFNNLGVPVGILDLGYDAFDLADPIHPGDSVANPNPGDVLAFNPVDLDGQHLNNRFRAGEFFLYDEYDPRRTIELDASGNLWKDGSQGAAYAFLLNFDETEGIWRAGGDVPKATGQQTTSYPAANDDGKDAIFGDLGNDWLVGGTGRDNLYGGWGNDLLNADDVLGTNGGLNDAPDTHPFYEDRAYGGAGRDVLIGNTGGDRLIDWVGEYNSYIVPYAPFGQASVSRTMMPHLHEFLYALSAGDGADFTRFADAIGGNAPAPTNNNPIPSRNGEPHGELGLVLQQDFAWGDQTGAPADPQAGNIPGGPRDVLRSAGFQDGSMEGFFVDTGKFSVESGQLQVAADSPQGDAISVYHVGDALPGYFEVQASISVVKPTSGWKANAYVVFDYIDQDDFKFAGIDDSTNKLVVGHRAAWGWAVDKQTPFQVKPDTTYNMLIAVNGVNVTVVVNNQAAVSHTFTPRVIDGFSYGLNYGLIGVGSDSSRGTYDNIAVKVLPPQITYEATETFSGGAAPLFPASAQSGSWAILPDGRFAGAPAAPGTVATAFMDLGVNGLYLDSVLELSATVSTATRAGFVFDRYSADDFKFVAIDAQNGRVILGHHSAKGGWATDAAFDRVIAGDADYTLGVVLKGAGVSVKLGGQVIGGHLYNAVVVDGDFGLLAADGPAKFDEVKVKTNDPGFVEHEGGSMIAATEASPGTTLSVTQSELDGIATAALTQWVDALGTGDPRLASLAGVRFAIGELPGGELGYMEANTIVIDGDAAGIGWYVDVSPAESGEFRVRLDRNVLAAAPESEAYGRFDLLTVVAHELGHMLGFDHDDAGRFAVMAEDLDPGVRYQIGAEPVAAAAGTPSRPAFDLYTGLGGMGPDASIDWQGESGGSWRVELSPYAPPKPSQPVAANLAQFELKPLNSQAGAGAEGFDRLGRELLGKGKTER